jgi:hypothetical protein
MNRVYQTRYIVEPDVLTLWLNFKSRSVNDRRAYGA